MTPSIDDLDVLSGALTQADALLFDFDGPVCNLFAGMSTAAVSERLRATIATVAAVDVPPEVQSSNDPLTVFRFASTVDEVVSQAVEARLANLELEASQGAIPTEGTYELVASWCRAGLKSAIVSNNGTDAIRKYLYRQNLKEMINVISARQSSDASLLKPSPHLLLCAIDTLQIDPRKVLFVGDSVTDMVAACRAGVPSLGYANRSYKIDVLRPSVGIVTSMNSLVQALRRR